jgi:hypothetical protein
MQRIRRLVGLLLPGLVGLAAVSPARALVVAPPPPVPARVAKAECIVLGKIISIEKTDVAARAYAKAPRKVHYRIAVLKVKERLKGARGQKTLRLGFIALARPSSSGSVTVKPTGPRFGTAFAVGQEGLFYLARHYEKAFFVAPTYYAFQARTHPNFKPELALVRFTLKIGDDPVVGLQSRDKQERLCGAALCIHSYRTYRGGSTRTEPIDARESRLILAALAEADWQPKGLISPWALFSQLGLTKKDGWTFPTKVQSPEDYYRAARAWLRKHGRTYRIKRIVGLDKSKTRASGG